MRLTSAILPHRPPTTCPHVRASCCRRPDLTATTPHVRGSRTPFRMPGPHRSRPPRLRWAGAFPQRPPAAARPHLRRRLHGAEPLVGDQPARRRPGDRRRHGHDDPARRRQHDGHRRSPDGRDDRPPRCAHRHPAGHPGRDRARRRRLGQKSRAPRLRHPDHPDADHDGRARRSSCCTSAPTVPPSSPSATGPVGIVTETDLTGVDRFTQIDDVMVARHGDAARTASTSSRPSTPCRTPGAGSPRSCPTTGGWSAS